MIRIITLCFLTLVILSGITRAEDDLLANLKKQHPRLIASDSTWSDLIARRKTDATLDRFLKKLEETGRLLLDAPPVEDKKIGKRLLSVSREAEQRILLLSFDFRVTHDPKFKDRAEKEMLAVAAFPDWNPSHFLDVGEMTAAMAFGYDWLYDVLPPASRDTLRHAIVEKGIKPGLNKDDPKNYFYRAKMNWNQVCFGGLGLGALAVAEDEPDLARLMLAEIRANNPNGMIPYAPMGVFPEGPSYWAYGTSYEVLLISALRSALGTDWGIDQAPGFMESADYVLQMTGPTRLFFDYSDGGEVAHLDPIVGWFALQSKRPDLLYFQHDFFEHYLQAPAKPDASFARMLPLLAVWVHDLDAVTPPTSPLAWHGRGAQSLAVFRSSWTDPKALYLALKGGSPSLNHGHMDAGSFVLDADGVRWSKDLGAQDYESLESKGLSIFGKDRWKVFRLTNSAHSTLTINGQLHDVKGNAPIIRFSAGPGKPHAVVDLSPTFAAQASKVVRGFMLLPDRQILIQDEIAGLKPGDEVRWAMVTGPAVKVDGTRATLSKDGQQMHALLAAPDGGKFEVIPAEPVPATTYDAPNPGVSILIAKLKAPASGKITIRVLLRPGATAPDAAALPTASCEDWSAPLPPETAPTP